MNSLQCAINYCPPAGQSRREERDQNQRHGSGQPRWSRINSPIEQRQYDGHCQFFWKYQGYRFSGSCSRVDPGRLLLSRRHQVCAWTYMEPLPPLSGKWLASVTKRRWSKNEKGNVCFQNIFFHNNFYQNKSSRYVALKKLPFQKYLFLLFFYEKDIFTKLI